jgi:hypothetical protein
MELGHQEIVVKVQQHKWLVHDGLLLVLLLVVTLSRHCDLRRVVCVEDSSFPLSKQKHVIPSHQNLNIDATAITNVIRRPCSSQEQ